MEALEQLKSPAGDLVFYREPAVGCYEVSLDRRGHVHASMVGVAAWDCSGLRCSLSTSVLLTGYERRCVRRLHPGAEAWHQARASCRQGHAREGQRGAIVSGLGVWGEVLAAVMADVLPHVCSVFEGAVNQLRGVPSGSKMAFKMQWSQPACWTWSADVLHALRWMCYVCSFPTGTP